MSYYDAYGVDPSADPLLKRVMQIESGGNPNARTGSYKGLYQLSDSEFNKYGGGDIYNPQDNSRAAQNKFAAETAQFTKQYGRPPSATDIYMTHQQGAGGYGAHMANPDAPAWQNMYSTAEGRQKGVPWAKQAIWGNVPDNLKQQYGSVDNLTSKQFVDLWRNKVEGGSQKMPGVDQDILNYQSPPPALSAQSTAGGRGMYGLADGMITRDGAPVYDASNALQGAGAWLMGINNPHALSALAGLRKEKADLKTGYNEKTGNFYAINSKGLPVITGRDPGFQNPTEEARVKGENEQFQKLYGDLQSHGSAAQQDLALVSQAKELFSRVGKDGKPLIGQGFGGELGMQAKSLYKTLGGDPEGLSEAQVADAITKQLTLRMKNQGGVNLMPGPQTDRDLAYLSSTAASLGKDPKTNQELLDTYERTLKRSQALADLARRHNNGRLDNSFYDKVSAHDKQQAESAQRSRGLNSILFE